MCKIFEINGQKDFYKAVIFLKILQAFCYMNYTGKLVLILFSLTFGIGSIVVWANCPKLCRNCASLQISHTMKLGETTVCYAMNDL